MKITFVQVSTNLINPNWGGVEAEYYNHLYSKRGWWKPEHFWEIPTWIARANHFLKSEHQTELYIATDLEQTIKDLQTKEVVLFSVLEVNKKIIEYIRDNITTPIICGGYTQPIENVIWLNKMEDLAGFFNSKYSFGTDYSLFNGVKTIPRLTLSTGCKHECKFCSIEKSIKIIDPDTIITQVNSFKYLQFLYVYIDDKTFGQAPNYSILKLVKDTIKKYNPNFIGFIIQTTATQINKTGFTQELVELGVVYVEIGLESFNDHILRKYKKPASEKLIMSGVKKMEEVGLNYIFNIIVGFPEETEETYTNTLNFILETSQHHINVYSLSVYDGTQLSQELDTVENWNELEINKSFHSENQKVLNLSFYEKLHKIPINTKVLA